MWGAPFHGGPAPCFGGRRSAFNPYDARSCGKGPRAGLEPYRPVVHSELQLRLGERRPVRREDLDDQPSQNTSVSESVTFTELYEYIARLLPQRGTVVRLNRTWIGATERGSRKREDFTQRSVW